MTFKKFSIVSILVLASQVASADAALTEIMYDLPGADEGREWIEVENVGSDPLDMSRFKLFQGNANHAISLFRGPATTSPGEFAVIADRPEKFLLDWPDFSGSLFDSSFSLANAAGDLGIKDGDIFLDQAHYDKSMGAAGDGNSLQKTAGAWKALPPSPGRPSPADAAAGTPAPAEASSNSSTTPSAGSADRQQLEAAPLEENHWSPWPVSPQIFASASGPSGGVVGADLLFEGQAVGIEKVPLLDPRFSWNFGDGATREGQAVLHAFAFPGEYVVVLEASSGKYSAMSRLTVSIIPADLSISAVVPGSEGRIEIWNRTKSELNLSWWRLRSGGQFFTAPKDTIILAGGKLSFSARVTGLAGGDAALLYPNGAVAAVYGGKEEAPGGGAPAGFAAAGADPSSPVLPEAAEKDSALPDTASSSEAVPTAAAAGTAGFLAAAAAAGTGGAEGSTTGAFSEDSPAREWYWWLLPVVILGGLAAPVMRAKKGSEQKDESGADDIRIIE